MSERKGTGPEDSEAFEAFIEECSKAGDEWATETILENSEADVGELIHRLGEGPTLVNVSGISDPQVFDALAHVVRERIDQGDPVALTDGGDWIVINGADEGEKQG